MDPRPGKASPEAEIEEQKVEDRTSVENWQELAKNRVSKIDLWINLGVCVGQKFEADPAVATRTPQEP